MKALISLLCVLFLGCMSAPERIGREAAIAGRDCREAAEIALEGMRRAGYAACYCVGHAYPGGQAHAWVEFTREDGRRWILDPYELLRERIGPSRVLLDREEWPKWYFRKVAKIGKQDRNK